MQHGQLEHGYYRLVYESIISMTRVRAEEVGMYHVITYYIHALVLIGCKNRTNLAGKDTSSKYFAVNKSYLRPIPDSPPFSFRKTKHNIRGRGCMKLQWIRQWGNGKAAIRREGFLYKNVFSPQKN